MPEYDNDNEVYVSPEIPLDKLCNALDRWLTIDQDEKILALIDASIWGDAKEGVALTNRRIIFTDIDRNYYSVTYKSLSKFWHTWRVKYWKIDQKTRTKMADLAYYSLGTIGDESKQIQWVE